MAEWLHFLFLDQAEEVIVSCGAIQSPALLQRSGIGPTSVLEPLGIPVVRDLPVGENMQDHPTIGCQMQLKEVRVVYMQSIIIELCVYPDMLIVRVRACACARV